MQVRIEDLVQRGEGLGRGPDGRLVFVSGALPGELAEVSVTKDRKDFLMGKAVGITDPSPDRVQPVCRFYGTCGGCNLMHLSYEAQVKAKCKVFLDTLRKFRLLEDNPLFRLEAPVTGKPLGYRTRVRFALQEGRAGFLGAESRRFVPIDHCPVLDERIDSVLADPQGLMTARGSMSARGLRRGSDPEVQQAGVCLCDDGPLLGEHQRGSVTILGRSIPLANDVFFQSNLSLLPEMISYVVSNVKGKRVMDLYSGIGLFSAFLEDNHEILAVERDPKCLEIASSHLRRCAFFTGSVEDFKFTGSHDTIIADPPRIGLDSKVPSRLGKLGAQRIIYVSCDSVTFARDAQRLREEGYALSSSKIFDFYPQTSHMESVNVLDRRF